ncbi:MAG TPA: hypothetical protein VGS19_12710 [Streptosporangiaceae bacterium]|nr:hypothetical protein [Streptosporangiaceae bacterium]
MSEDSDNGEGMTATPPQAGGTSRRAFVLGGAAIGAAGVIGGRRGPDVTAQQRRRAGATARPAAKVGSKAEVGATVSAGNPGGSTRLEAAQIFDTNMGGRKMAMAVERVYWGPGKWQTGPNTTQEVATLNGAGIAIVGSFTPSQTLTNAELTNLKNSLAQLKSQNAIVDAICLTHEPNYQKFPSAQAYQKYINFYGPAVVEAGYALAYIPVVLTTAANDVAAFYPTGTLNGQPLVTRMYGDFYCSTQYTSGVRLDGFFNVAVAHNTPRVGIGEFGRTDSALHPPTDQQFRSYTQYLTQEWQAWNAAGHDSAVIMYFTNGAANNPTPDNYLALEALWDALSIDHT